MITASASLQGLRSLSVTGGFPSIVARMPLVIGRHHKCVYDDRRYIKHACPSEGCSVWNHECVRRNEEAASLRLSNEEGVLIRDVFRTPLLSSSVFPLSLSFVIPASMRERDGAGSG